MVPSVAFAVAPNVMAQELVPVDESVHRPARLRGGATAGEPLAAAPPPDGLLDEPLSHVKRSLPPLQAASSAVQARIERAAMRAAMDTGWDLKKGRRSCLPECRHCVRALSAAAFGSRLTRLRPRTRPLQHRGRGLVE